MPDDSRPAAPQSPPASVALQRLFSGRFIFPTTSPRWDWLCSHFSCCAHFPCSSNRFWPSTASRGHIDQAEHYRIIIAAKCRSVLLRHCGDGKHVPAGIATDTKLVRNGHKAGIDIDYITSLPVSSCPSPQGFSVANFKTRSSSAVVTGSTVATFLISVTAAFKLTGEMRTLPSKGSGTKLAT
jgi:hypothetical protein